jgi:hypothetical protein
MGSVMKRWTIGSRDRKKADLILDHETVSGLHADLICTDDGRFRVLDRESTNGIARLVNGQWVRVTQAYVSADERLRFGKAETSIRELLNGRPSPILEKKPAESRDSWSKELVNAFSEIRHPSEIKKNFFFAMDLLSSPVYRTMRSAARNDPVNPFCFMVFGVAIYGLIGATGLNLTQLLNGNFIEIWKSIPGLLPVLIISIAAIFMVNIIPYGIFNHFSLQKRALDEFMRVTAVVSGMDYVMASFLIMSRNEWLTMAGNLSKKSDISPETFFHMTGLIFLISVMVVLYIISYHLMVQKYFWKMTYSKTAVLFLVSYAAYLISGVIVAIPFVLFLGA